MESHASPWHTAWSHLKQKPIVLCGTFFVLFLAILCALAPCICTFPYTQQNLELGPVPPCAAHWLGTDLLGRDLLSRILYGGRISFSVGLLATGVALSIGVLYGMISGYCRNRIDQFMMRIVDILYATPFTIFVILLMVLFGRQLWLIFIAIGAVEWLSMARIVRGQVKSLKTQPFIKAARCLGQKPAGIFRHHLLPNVFDIIIVYATLTVPNVMLLEAFLSFLGLGVQAPMTSWGDLIHMGASTMEEFPWLLLFPSMVFSLTLLSLNFLGDALRDALDPH